MRFIVELLPNIDFVFDDYAPFAGHLVRMLVGAGAGNLLPLGIIVLGFFSLPAILAARAGAFLANKWAAPVPS